MGASHLSRQDAVEHQDLTRLAGALGDLTIEASDNEQALSRRLDPISASNLVQHLQIPVTGRVGRKPISLDFKVSWPYPFLMRVGPRQQDGALQDPHFVHGIHMLGSVGFVILQVQITDWIESDSQFVTGANVKVVAWSPDSPKRHLFNAIVHMSFFGYGAPSDDDSEG